MELFNEVKNRYFLLIYKIINECENGKSKEEIVQIIDEGEFEQKVIGKNQQSFADLVLNRCLSKENFCLLSEEDGKFYPSIRNCGNPPLPIRFTNLEKAWLKALLDKDKVRLILGKNTYEKLHNKLKDIDTPIREEYFELTNTINLPQVDNEFAYESNFNIILSAIIKEKPIRYNNTDKRGNVYKNKLAVPINIEYSMRDGRFRVSMYSIDDDRPIMANIFSLSSLRIVDEDVEIDREKAKELLIEQKYSGEPIILEVTDSKAAMERCFMCFSGMERTARDLGEGKYEIRLNYYMFEEENIIRNIISLGPYVRVLSPQRIADEVIRRVRKSIDLYKEIEK